MAWKQIKTGIIGEDTFRNGSFSRRMLFIWCMLASAIFYLIPQNYSNRFQLTFAHIFRFPLNASGNISTLARTQKQTDNTVPRSQYDTLRNKYANLEQTVIQQRLELKKLSNLNSFVGENVNFILGYVIPASADLQRSELTIRCRGTEGLEKGQFVLARDNSIIGRITDIFPQLDTAKVRLITNPDSKIPVQIEDLNKGILQGSGDNTAKISNISTEKEIKVGQQVFVQRDPEFLDASMIAGTVSKCKQDYKSPVVWDITVEPTWKPEELNEIAVIIMKPKN
jgi:cell shape-determining protein MreC